MGGVKKLGESVERHGRGLGGKEGEFGHREELGGREGSFQAWRGLERQGEMIGRQRSIVERQEKKVGRQS
jgi:hypothetical protein